MARRLIANQFYAGSNPVTYSNLLENDMKVLIGLIMYMIISGLFAGFAIKDNESFCKRQLTNTSSIKIIEKFIYWPVYLGALTIIDKRELDHIPCN